MGSRIKPYRPVLQRGHPLARGLVLALPFWERGGVTVRDEAIRQPGTFTATGCSWVQSQLGPAVRLDGSAGAIEWPEPPNSETDLNTGTVAGWFRTSSPGAGYRGLFVKQLAYGLFIVDSVLTAYDWGPDNTPRSTGVNVADGFWHHTAFVFRSGVAGGSAIYIDGKLVLSTSITISSHANGFAIGSGDNPATIQLLNGDIGGSTLHNRALIPAEIASLYLDPWGMYRPNFITQSDPFGLMGGLGPAAAAVAQRLQRDNIIAEWWRRRAFR